MDTKALAKSKRAHSLHHSKKPHPHPKPKPKPAGESSSGARGSKAAAEKPAQLRQSRAAPALPSNWDRYEEELDSDAGAPSSSSEVPSQSSELPPPKSKGADYRHLIAEAKAQPLSHTDPYLDSFPSMDDVLPDFFSRGASPLLSARAEAIVSMAEDDSFLVEDKPMGSHELPFLSLNLNLLAKQLSKVDLAKRLFIERDLLPPELLAETSASSSGKELEKVQTGETEASLKRGFNLNHSTEKETKKDEKLQESSTREPTFSVNQVAVDISQFHPPNPSTAQESTKQPPSNAVAELKNATSTFKAAAAEAELDALLDSFNDADLTDKVDSHSSRSALSFEIKSSKAPHQVSRKGSESSKTEHAPKPANIDDLLDDLLEETSKLKKQNGLRGPESSVPNASSKSEVLDDFDNWLDTL